MSMVEQQLAAIAGSGKDRSNHVIVIARAGTGKTFTIFKGVMNMFGLLEDDIVPSPQQAAVWEEMNKGTLPKTILQVAFNKSIVEEATEKYAGVIGELSDRGTTMKISTIHSAGFSTLRYNLKGKVKVNDRYKLGDTLEQLTGCSMKDYWDDKDYGTAFTQMLKKLVDLVRLNLTKWYEDKEDIYFNVDDLNHLCDHYGIERNGMDETVILECFELVGRVIGYYLENHKEIDFTDMIWLPVVKELSAYQNDLVLVDEAQDLSPCQREMVLKLGKRFVFVGDDRQAIYGFAGADIDSLDLIERRLEESREVTVLPLTVTRRCGKKIVEKAACYVSDFEAHENNSEGIVDQCNEESLIDEAKGGDMILCRVNAPLAKLVFQLVRSGKPAYIRGRDIGDEMIRLCKKMKARGIGDLLDKLADWYESQLEKLNRQGADMAQVAVKDKYDCLTAILANCGSINKIEETIREIFTDERDPDSVMLSSVHKAKGLESARVFLLRADLMPHPMAKVEWQQYQEQNLKYVAITRAINQLTYIG